MANRLQADTTRRYLLVISLLVAVGLGGSVVKEATAAWLSPPASLPMAAQVGDQSAENPRRPPKPTSKPPLPFEPNAGQAAHEVRFVARSKTGTLFFTPSGLDIAFRKAADANSTSTRNSIDSGASASDASLSAATGGE